MRGPTEKVVYGRSSRSAGARRDLRSPARGPQGHAVESICRVLREQGCPVAARTYGAWRAHRPACCTVSDAHVVDAVRDIAWRVADDGQRKLTPEGLYGRRKMTAHLRRMAVPEATVGSVDRAIKTLGLRGVRRDKGIRITIPAKDGVRAGDLLNRTFTAPAPNLVWVTDFNYIARSLLESGGFRPHYTLKREEPENLSDRACGAQGCGLQR